MDDNPSPELLLELLNEIMDTPNVSAAQVIRAKLSSPTQPSRPLETQEIRSLLGKCIPPSPPAAPTDAVVSHLRAALAHYVAHQGAVCSPMLPQAQRLDGVSGMVYLSFLHSDEPIELRWALCRVLLELQFQWWWVHTTLTPMQAHAIIYTTEKHFQRYWVPQLTGSHLPWSPGCVMRWVLKHSFIRLVSR